MNIIYIYDIHTSKQVIWMPYNAYITYAQANIKYGWILYIYDIHTSKQVIWMPYNAYITHMHKQTKNMDEYYIYMTYTQANKSYECHTMHI